MQMITDRFRKELAQFRPYVQGKPIEVVRRELGLDRIEKLASNENQFGPSPKAVAAMKAELDGVNFYPEGHPYELVTKLSKRLGVDEDMLIIGNGGEGILWNIAMTMLNEGDEVIMAYPSFDIYDITAIYFGATCHKVPLIDNHFDIDGMLAKVNEKTKIFWLCTPNNPTGNVCSVAELDRIVAQLPEDVLLVIDEAYYEFATARDDYKRDNLEYLKTHDNILVLRTFSKIYGLAGTRIGYAVANAAVASKANMIRQTFGINRLAQVAALAALDDEDYLQYVIESNSDALKTMEDYFDSRGLKYITSYANFIWVDLGVDSKKLFTELEKLGVIIRAGYLWGYDTCARISTGTKEQMRFLLECLDQVL
ncbi:MAG: histidinol-phosphate transaminase [Clostridiales Family XIII bacterium]|jgi:histidinol-phosphate aminotransferase|nr:histidinol-phosphate transaminase [Clostridiales Family XIII bacterium]